MIHPTMLQNFSLTMLQNIKVLKKKKKNINVKQKISQHNHDWGWKMGSVHECRDEWTVQIVDCLSTNKPQEISLWQYEAD